MIQNLKYSKRNSTPCRIRQVLLFLLGSHILTFIITITAIQKTTAAATSAASSSTCLSRNSSLLCEKYYDASCEHLFTISSDFIVTNSTKKSSATVNDDDDDKCNLVSLVTHLTMSRAYMLKLQARHWLGPMCVVFYGTTGEANNLAKTVFSSPVLSMRSNIAYHHVLQRTDPELYPGNILENIALKQVHTSYAITVDIDFLPRPGMCDRLQEFLLDTATRGGVAHPLDKVVYILPLFGEWFVDRSEFARQYPQDKSALIKLWKGSSNPLIREYAFGWFPVHGPTNFSRWINATEPYEIEFKEHFEPVYLYRLQTVENAARSIANELPPNFVVQTRYMPMWAGYGNHRSLSTMTLTLLGFKMLVLPDEYMIHVDHKISEARHKFKKYLICVDETWKFFNRHRTYLCKAQQKMDPEFFKQNSICLADAALYKY